jgi:hypothetical protein
MTVGCIAFGAAGCGGGGARSVSPIQDLYGTRDELMERQRQIERVVAQCMRDRGWKYLPSDVNAQNVGSDPEFVDATEYRKKFGYGISIRPVLSTSADPTALVDPNNTYTAVLSDSERLLFFKDLEGSGSLEPAIAETNTGTVSVSIPTDCRSEGERAVPRPPADAPEVRAALNELGAAQNRDPRLVGAQAKWSRCMKDVGYNYAVPNDAREDIAAKFSSLMRGAVAPAPSADSSDGPRDNGGGAPDQVALAELRAIELATAKADGACDEKYLAVVIKQLDQEIYDSIVNPDHSRV